MTGAAAFLESKHEKIPVECAEFHAWRHVGEMLEAGAANYGELKNMIVWVKDNGGMRSFYRSRHELIFAFKNGVAPHLNSFELATLPFTGSAGTPRKSCPSGRCSPFIDNERLPSTHPSPMVPP